tara:strand:+ start:1131 stop:2990 length:1860 start_codon:yes stop_codon:yes gene_type:complete
MTTPPSEAFSGHAPVEPLDTHYSAKFQRFVVLRDLTSADVKIGADKESRLNHLARNLQNQPIPGLATLLDFQTHGERATGVFETLPGHSLDRLVKETNGFADSVWCELALQLLDLCERVYDQDGIGLTLDPRLLYVWQNESEQISIACATCEFQVTQEQETTLWVYWLRSLSVLWFYMATGEWESYFNLTKRNLDDVPQLRDRPQIQEFLDLLFHEDIEFRVFDRRHIRILLEHCEDQIGDHSFPVSFLRRLNSLPSRRRCLDWLPAEREFPAQYCISAAGRDARQPTILPAIDEIANRPVLLHVLPPRKSVDRQMRQLCLQAERWKRSPDPNLPILPIHNSWKSKDCTVFAESSPNGLNLARVLMLSKVGLRVSIALDILRKVDSALRQIDRKGYKIPAIDPTSIYLVASEKRRIDPSNLEWLEDSSSFEVKLRILPTQFLHTNDPATYGADAKIRLIRKIVGVTQEVGFAELAGRLLSRRELALDAVTHAIRRASTYGHRTSSFVRATLLAELQRSLTRPNSKPAPMSHAPRDMAAWWDTALLPMQRVALGTTATLGLVAFLSSVGLANFSASPSEPLTVENEDGNLYLGTESPVRDAIAPPEDLTPVSGADTPVAK